jgi:hypothetical protein
VGPGRPPQPGPEATTERAPTEAGEKKEEDVIDAEYEVKEQKE